MKLKCVPEDFQVTEISQRQPTAGPYSLYRLSKTSIGTLEALASIKGTWNLAGSQVSHAGLKDKQAVTSQLVTIRNGPRQSSGHAGFELTYLGGTDQPIGADDIVGNQFRIVVRAVQPVECDLIRQRTSADSTFYFPNYFDSQRFGSLGASGEFVAAAWCKRDFERATWLALADFNHHDRTAERRDKAFLRDNWNDWLACKAQIARSNRRSVITYLCDHPTKFRKAFALIDPDMRGLYLSAFQSAVWNRVLKSVIESSTTEPEGGFQFEVGDTSLRFAASVSDAIQQLTIPLPSARARGLNADTRNICEQVLKHYSLSLSEMKLAFPRDKWFSRAERAAFIAAEGLTMAEQEDELHPGKRAVTLKFQLGRGAYATMLVKSLTGGDLKSKTLSETSTEETE